MDKKVEAAPRWDGLDKVLGAYLFKVAKERVLLLPGLREYSSYFVEPLAPIGLARGAPDGFRRRHIILARLVYLKNPRFFEDD